MTAAGVDLVCYSARDQELLTRHWEMSTTRSQYSTVQFSTVQYSTAQYSTVQYSTVQYTTRSLLYVSSVLVLYLLCLAAIITHETYKV